MPSAISSGPFRWSNSFRMTYIDPRLGALAFRISDWPEMPTVCSTPSMARASASMRAITRRVGRAEGERIEGREHGRDGDRHRELAEELSGDASDERARHEHGTEHQSDGDDGAGHLVHGLAGGLARRMALLQPALDVLDDDNGIVHHDADSQHQP